MLIDSLKSFPLFLAAMTSLGASWGLGAARGLVLAGVALSLAAFGAALAFRGRRMEKALSSRESRFREAVSGNQEAERKLQAAEDHLRQSQKMEAVGRLAGGIAHDFNNLLTTINGYAELVITRLPEGDPNRPMLDEIRKAGDRAAAITRQLLTFSRKQLISPVVMDLNSLVRDLDRMLSRLLGPGVELTADLAADLDAIEADPGQVAQVILNLSLNGRDAMAAGGRLALATSNVELRGDEEGYYLRPAPGSYACLRVEDSGAGMAADVKQHLFEPFFTTKIGDRGTGMGLPTVYGIVDQNRGGIRVMSEEGMGAVFLVYFPQSARAQDWQPRPDEASVPAEKRRPGETILVVEDEETVRHMVGSVLRTRGYEVLEASGAREAMYIHENHLGSIKVLLTDVIMPGRSGREIARDFQRLRPGIRVIFMSGYTDDILLQQGMEASKAVFLGKPFTPSELLNKLAESEALAAVPAQET